MTQNRSERQLNLPMTICGVALAVTAAAVIATMVGFRSDSKEKKIADAVIGKVAAVLDDTGPDGGEPHRDGETTDDNPAKKLTTLLEELSKLPRPTNASKPFDIPTARDRARNGDIEAAKFLIKTFDTMQRDMAPSSEVPSKEGSTDELEKIDDEILKELGISEKELALFRSADELLFHLDLLESGEKLKAMAKELEDSGARFISGKDHESALSELRYPMIAHLLCRYGGLGPGGENESLFLKLVGKSQQQLQDVAHSTYDYYYQNPNLHLTERDVTCLDYIQQTFGFPAAAKEEFDLEIK